MSDQIHSDEQILDPRFDGIIALSQTISRQMGRGGVLDTKEQAIKKLFIGDPSKKTGDQAEALEILTELNRSPIDFPDLAGEIADFEYYRAKIPDMDTALESQLLTACGFTQSGAIKAAEVKYTVRINANEQKLPKNERKLLEKEALRKWLESDAIPMGLFKPENINAGDARLAIDSLTKQFSPSEISEDHEIK